MKERTHSKKPEHRLLTTIPKAAPSQFQGIGPPEILEHSPKSLPVPHTLQKVKAFPSVGTGVLG